MAYSIYDTTKFRKELLNGGDFNEIHFNFIKTNEGYKYCAYDDVTKQYVKDLKTKGLEPKGKITVGIGYNMENGDSEWVKAFKHLRDKMPNFLDVKEGRACLKTDEQVKMLFEVNVKTRIKKLTENYYRNEWQYMTPNEQLAIEDLFFNTEIGLVTNTLRKDDKGKYIKTNFYKNFPLYIAAKRNGDMELAKLYLDVCLWEVKHHSNGGDTDLQQRRDSEAAMLNTYDAKITKERSASVIEKEISAIIERRKAGQISDTGDSNLVKQVVIGFTNNFKAFMEKKFNSPHTLNKDDIEGIKHNLRAFMKSSDDAMVYFDKIKAIVSPRLDKMKTTKAIKDEVLGFLNMGLRYCQKAKKDGRI